VDHPTQLKRRFRIVLMMSAATAAGMAATSAGPASAADVAAAAAPVETVTITGTRIPQRDYFVDSPLTTVGAEQLQATGAITPEQLLNTLPQVVPASTISSNNPGNNGAANIDLRGLGPNRNIVLIDGRRAQAFDESLTVDLNAVPVALIERVEVITGGASAVYGADAVAGVVNFILKKDFEGAALDYQYGQTFYSADAMTMAGSVTIGGNFAEDKGNAVLSYDYSFREALFKGARSYTAQATTSTSYFPESSFRPTAANPVNEGVLDAYFASHGGAPASNQSGSNTALGINSDKTLFTVGTAGGPGSNVYNFKNSPAFPATIFCHNSATPTDCDVYSFNFEPYNKLILPLERHTLTALGHYEFLPNIEAYAFMTFTNYNADTELAPSPAPTSSVNAPNGSNCGINYCVPVSNPNIPADLRALLATRTGNSTGLVGTGALEDFTIRRRFLEGGGRREVYTNDVFQAVGGIRGDIPNTGMVFDIFAVTGRFDQLTTQFGNLSNSAVESLLYGTASATGCSQATFNVFGPNIVTPDCTAFISRTTKNSSRLEQENFEGSISGPIGAGLPAGDIQFSLGADYLSQDFDFLPDTLAATGDISGFNAQTPISGAIYQKELFAELQVPILENMPYAQALSATFGYRYTDHSTVGGINTYKAEGQWTPLDLLRFRGSYQRAVRAPNINELFAPTFQDNPELVDPCNFNSSFRTGPNKAQVEALCIAQGITPAQLVTFVQSNSQINAVSGGNINLKEETADTYTIGAVITPQFESPWLSGFRGTLDYWRIDLAGPIGIDAGSVLYGCFNADGSNPTYSNANANCRLLVTSPGSVGPVGVRSGGDIGYISAFLTNLVSTNVSGIDATFNWTLDLADTVGAAPGWGSVSFDFQGTWLQHYREKTAPTATEYDYAGTTGTNGPNNISRTWPKWKYTLMATWANDVVSLSGRMNYMSSMKNRAELVLGPGALANGLPVTGVPSTYYFDFFGRYKLPLMQNVYLRAGLLNAFNKRPPVFNPNVQDGTDPGAYDVIGRRWFMGLNIQM
jgi:iron complex outermembrane receptor protein